MPFTSPKLKQRDRNCYISFFIVIFKTYYRTNEKMSFPSKEVNHKRCYSYWKNGYRIHLAIFLKKVIQRVWGKVGGLFTSFRKILQIISEFVDKAHNCLTWGNWCTLNNRATFTLNLFVLNYNSSENGKIR